MQNRISAHACFDAYLKKAVLGRGSASTDRQLGGTKMGFPPERDHGRGVSDGLPRVQHRWDPLDTRFSREIGPRGPNLQNVAFGKKPQNGRYFGLWRSTLHLRAPWVGLRGLPGGRVRPRPPEAKHACNFHFLGQFGPAKIEAQQQESVPRRGQRRPAVVQASC